MSRWCPTISTPNLLIFLHRYICHVLPGPIWVDGVRHLGCKESTDWGDALWDWQVSLKNKYVRINMRMLMSILLRGDALWDWQVSLTEKLYKDKLRIILRILLRMIKRICCCWSFQARSGPSRQLIGKPTSKPQVYCWGRQKEVKILLRQIKRGEGWRKQHKV